MPTQPSPDPFPTHALPQPLADFVTATSQAILCPPEWIAYPALAAAGALIGPRIALHLSPTWSELPSLWTAIVAPTGSGKTTALTHALAPFVAIHQAPLEAWRARGSEHVRRAFEETIAAFADILAHTTERPPQFLASPESWDSVASISAHVQGAALVYDNLATALGAIARTNPFALSHLRDRWSATRVETRPDHRQRVLALIGGLSPGALSSLARTEGLIETFLLIGPGQGRCAWPCQPVQNPSPPDLVPWLLPLRRVTPYPEDAVPHPVHLDPGAESVWAEWYTANAARSDEATGFVRGVLRKLPAQVARLALILHVLAGCHPERRFPFPGREGVRGWGEGPRRSNAVILAPLAPLPATTLRHAIALAEFACTSATQIETDSALSKGAIHHASTIDRIGNLAGRVERHLAAIDDWISRSELVNDLGRPVTSHFDAALDRLTTDRKLRTRTSKAGGTGFGRPRIEYRTGHPEAMPKDISATGTG